MFSIYIIQVASDEVQQQKTQEPPAVPQRPTPKVRTGTPQPPVRPPITLPSESIGDPEEDEGDYVVPDDKFPKPPGPTGKRWFSTFLHMSKNKMLLL